MPMAYSCDPPRISLRGCASLPFLFLFFLVPHLPPHLHLPPPPHLPSITPLRSAFNGLSDQDRIFTNLYGEQDWRLKDALTRGDYHQTKEIMWMDPTGSCRR